MVKFADVDEQYKNWKNLKKEDVMNVMEWMKHQPHLPEISELQTILFLHSCYYSNEATKKCIDTYFTVRKHCPEFFTARDPTSTEIRTSARNVSIAPMPNLTPEGYLVFYLTLRDTNPDNFNLIREMKLFDMITSHYLAEHGLFEGHVLVIDLLGFTLTHVMKLWIMTVKKFLFYLQEALPFRLKGIHFVNAVPFIDKIIGIVKPFLNKETVDVLQIHQSGDKNLYKVIPKDCLPYESGGNQGKIVEIHTRNFNTLLDSVKYFEEEEKMVTDETKRPGRPKNAGDLFGVEGTFKKLDID